MPTTTPPLASAQAITLDGSTPQERAFLDVFTCQRCHHAWEDHGLAGAVPPSKSKCQLDGCACARFMRDGDTE